ncbi:hypothetical protein GCM10020358_62100 [Amorphoplanes nipponensis]|uniref:Uncharacterized protein n=1 Tax=Actinoplanes nipponensis TaxID=135950 RepID=A0A919JMH9_9ACTN|nr:hypothetical protein Ani05nite_54790 [Actinoplanes nipponensis]
MTRADAATSAEDAVIRADAVIVAGAVAPAGRMTAGGALAEPVCGAAAFLRPGGPVQVPLRPCCAAAFVRAAGTPGLSFPDCLRDPLGSSGPTSLPVPVGPGGEVIP